MAMVVLFMLKAMYTREHGKTIKRMDLATIHTTTEVGMKDSGQRINKTVKESRNGLMVQNTQVSIKKVRNTVMENLSGLIRAPTKVTSSTIISMVKASIFGPMEEFSMEIGSKIEWKVKVSSHGVTAVSTLENIKTIKNMDTEYLHGQTEGAMTVNGTKASNMVKEFT